MIHFISWVELFLGEVIIAGDNTPYIEGVLSLMICFPYEYDWSHRHPKAAGFGEVGLPGHFITLGTQSEDCNGRDFSKSLSS